MKGADKNKSSNMNLNDASNLIQSMSPKSCQKANLRKPSFEFRNND